MNYLSFDLYIEPSGQKYRARVVNSPGGEAEAEFSSPITDQELKIFRLETTRARPDLRRAEAEGMRAVKEFGHKLYKAVFADEVGGCLTRSLEKIKPSELGLRVRVHLSKTPELANLPWEYLYESSRNQFLALSRDTPVVRYIELPVEARALAVKPPVRMLVVISSPEDLPPLNVDREWKELQEGLARLTSSGILNVDRLEKPSFQRLLRAVERTQYHILHFVGHGQFDRDHGEGVLMFEDEEGKSEPITAQALGVLVYDAASLRLAVLNSCEGATADSTDLLGGTAQTLIQQGIPAVIAMQTQISEGGAQCFAEAFYEALAGGTPVDAALASARKNLYGTGSVEWGAPVLYMRSPDGQLFQAGRLTVEIGLSEADRATTRKDWAVATEKLKAVLALDPADPRAKEKLAFVEEQIRVTAQLLADADRATAASDQKAAIEKLRAALTVSPNDVAAKDKLALAQAPPRKPSETAGPSPGVSPPVGPQPGPTRTGPVPVTRPQPRPEPARGLARVLHSPRFAPTVLLVVVFLFNWLETFAETAMKGWHAWGGETSKLIAYAFHSLEGNFSFEHQDLAGDIAIYGYSSAYFFLFPILGLAVALALARHSSPWAYRSFAIAVGIDYAISLPFFLAFPVPERWAYPDAAATLLSDRWTTKLIEMIRPISGLDNCFPSSHVSLTVIFIAFCYRYRLRLRTAVLLLGLTVILSTFVLGIHWIPDIVAGLALGILSAELAMILERRKHKIAAATQSMKLKLERWSSGVRRLSDGVRPGGA
jgi:membrane-associated phospholipid phosphatase